MNYFDYQETSPMGRVWSLFSDLAEMSEEEKMGESYYSTQYAHTLEIVSSALRGSLATDDSSLQAFNLQAYEYKCNENERKNLFKEVEHILYIVDSVGEEDEGVGYGDISDRKLKFVEDSYEELESLESFDSSLRELYNIRSKYITSNGIDLVEILVSSLQGIPEAISKIHDLTSNNRDLKDIITSLCEDGKPGMLKNQLEMLL